MEPDVFEMFISPELEYPLVCLGVRKGDEKTHLNFDIINLNSSSSWFIDLETLKGVWIFLPLLCKQLDETDPSQFTTLFLIFQYFTLIISPI